jgi:hypothetical protein
MNLATFLEAVDPHCLSNALRSQIVAYFGKNERATVVSLLPPNDMTDKKIHLSAQKESLLRFQ